MYAYLHRFKFKVCHKINFWLLGSITPENARQQLKTAIGEKDKKSLVTTIKESVSTGLPGLDVDIQEARDVLYKLEGVKGG